MNVVNSYCAIKARNGLFDSAKIVNEHEGLCIGYVAFYGDVEHEVAKVKSGYRVTLTYNLYSTPSSPAVSRNVPESTVQLTKKHDGKKLSLYNNLLKGADAELMDIARQLHLTASLHLYYSIEEEVMQEFNDNADKEWEERDGVMIDFLPQDNAGEVETSSYAIEYLLANGGKKVSDSGWTKHADMVVTWVTELNNRTRHETPFVAYGNYAELEYAYGSLCMVLEVGPYGHREMSL
ncbi:hypothetical protein EUX98_g7979 [Antrodiella citrinella]|uniref:Prolyl 4-hydroxylase alpha subunit Fe(2+) 2OG dioxygenase domain-containing protein n=1 Tax=Antrodiella citrinella TaxID=2447956 RepID=A0A4S4MCI0_9APHY|nr:hypothetical protein EUX98_g7979 [Antrodiella citrinella]